VQTWVNAQGSVPDETVYRGGHDELEGKHAGWSDRSFAKRAEAASITQGTGLGY
jgi:hypothetical protein